MNSVESTDYTEFVKYICTKSESRTHNFLHKRQRWYHSAMKTQVTKRIFKLIHASVIYQILQNLQHLQNA